MLDRMRASARWRRAVRDAQASHRWMRLGGVSVVVAGMAWFVPWRLGMLSAPPISGVSVSVVAPLAGLIGLLATPLLEVAWHYWRAPVRLTDELDRRVAALDQARTVQPIARLQFDVPRCLAPEHAGLWRRSSYLHDRAVSVRRAAVEVVSDIFGTPAWEVSGRQTSVD